MNNKSLIQKIKNLPVPILPTMVGASTLANVYSGMGYTWVRHLTIWAAIAVLIAYIVKIVAHFDTVKNEYFLPPVPPTGGSFLRKKKGTGTSMGDKTET